MNILKKAIVSGLAVTLTMTVLSIGSGNVFADCFQYNQNGFTTSATPVFNNICGVPQGVGNESNFVRIRKNSNGDDTDNVNNPTYAIGTLSSRCTSGNKYDVWNYLHNDAYSQDNNNGSGSAVATNVVSDMTAPLGSSSTTFQFGDTVSASNAVTVSDSASLNCDSKNVTLSLVPGSIHIFSVPYGSWKNLPDSTLNSPLTLGSPSFGSGIMWGCWDYRIVVVYQVQVTKIKTTTTTTTTTTTPTTITTTPTPTPTPTPTLTSTPPQQLVNTGPGTYGIAAAFLLVTFVAGIGFRRYSLKQLSKL